MCSTVVGQDLRGWYVSRIKNGAIAGGGMRRGDVKRYGASFEV